MVHKPCEIEVLEKVCLRCVNRGSYFVCLSWVNMQFTHLFLQQMICWSRIRRFAACGEHDPCIALKYPAKIFREHVHTTCGNQLSQLSTLRSLHFLDASQAHLSNLLNFAVKSSFILVLLGNRAKKQRYLRNQNFVQGLIICGRRRRWRYRGANATGL